MLTRAQESTVRRLARDGVKHGSLKPLVAYINGLLLSPDAGIAQLVAGPPERKRRLYLGMWAKIRDAWS